MGIPKFFRWCAERYPTIITPFTDTTPPVDNLYIDMNGIIHVCARSNATDVASRHMSEEAIVRAVFAYLDRIFTAIQPRKHFVMAVDGVAPRAKMNQQRQRRFRKIIDAEAEAAFEIEPETKEEKEMIESTPAFDSNCITPGTTFMVRMSEHLEYYINYKMQTHSAWRNCKVVYSGHQCPGEGEHKIMEFIRNRKMEPGYSPNETHCLYGLDADLIMLALASHEPNFVLLREVVTFGQSRKERTKLEEDEARGITEDKALDSPSGFVLLHISLLREYIYLDLKPKNLERTIDDFVFMCFFVGNDFLPSLPSLNIGDGALTDMFEVYQRCFVANGRFLTDQKDIQWDAVQDFLKELGQKEWATIQKRQRDMAKREGADDDNGIISRAGTIEEYKRLYYREKLGFKNVARDVRELTRAYIEGLKWVMEYYYDGCCSWKWYFEHHYAPMASDIHEMVNLAQSISFELGRPFTPHQQLLAVLPPQSHPCVPKVYWDLMLSEDSPLQQFCPDISDIKIDREGTRNSWEGIVLLPFLEEKVLLDAFESVKSKMSERDAANNAQLPTFVFEYEPLSSYSTSYEATLPNFPNLPHCKVRRRVLDVPTGVHFNAALCPGVKLFSNSVEGYGTFSPQLDKITTEIREGSVRVFGQVSRQPSLIVSWEEARASSAQDAVSLIGKEVYVGYPHLKRAVVTSLCDMKMSFFGKFDSQLNLINTPEPENHNEREERQFKDEAKKHHESLLNTCGCDLVNCDVLVYVKRVTGMRWNKKGKPLPTFAPNESAYPIQLVVPKEEFTPIPDGRYSCDVLSIGDLRTATDVVYLPEKTNEQYYGCVGIVESVTPRESGKQETLYSIMLSDHPSPTEEDIPQSARGYVAAANWQTVNQLASLVELPVRVVLTICGAVRTSPAFGMKEIGLGLINTSRNLSRVGYTKRVRESSQPWYVAAPNIFATLDDTQEGGNRASTSQQGGAKYQGNGTWMFSTDAVALVKDFCAKFRPYVRSIPPADSNAAAQHYDALTMMVDEWVDADITAKLNEIEAFVNALPFAGRSFAPAFDEILPHRHIHALEDSLVNVVGRDLPTNSSKGTTNRKIRVRDVPLTHIYVPTMTSRDGVPVSLPLPAKTRSAHNVLDRVVYCHSCGSVPLGARGTIIRILGDGKHAEVVMDEPQLGCSTLQGRLQTNRGCILKRAALLVITPTNDATVTPQTAPTVNNPTAILKREQPPSSGSTATTTTTTTTTTTKSSTNAAKLLGIKIGGGHTTETPSDASSPMIAREVSPLVLPSANRTPLAAGVGDDAGVRFKASDSPGGEIRVTSLFPATRSTSSGREGSVTDFFKNTTASVTSVGTPASQTKLTTTTTTDSPTVSANVTRFFEKAAAVDGNTPKSTTSIVDMIKNSTTATAAPTTGGVNVADAINKKKTPAATTFPPSVATHTCPFGEWCSIRREDHIKACHPAGWVPGIAATNTNAKKKPTHVASAPSSKRVVATTTTTASADPRYYANILSSMLK
eukprot:PhM_4_TR17072/c1_g1_i1/m.87210/K12618/XRN1, SEP1, KEM1; 5'-3' exoribonuclease 1